MKQQLLLLEDVDSLGRKGELVSAKPGYTRNYLLPKGLVMIASAHTVKKQEALKKERQQQAIIDRKESEALAIKIGNIKLEIDAKVDPEGHMYGSVSASDVAELFQKQDLPIEKKHVQFTKPLKKTGIHEISLKLKEDVMVTVELNIIPQGGRALPVVEVAAPEEETVVEEKPTEE